MCSKCPPSTETHAGWSHLIWHNFVTVGDNWIKICILTCICTSNRCVKFGLKLLIFWEKCQKMPACVAADGGHFVHMMWTGWSRLIWHNFVNVADDWIKICNLAWIGTLNRHIKFGWKIPNRFGKIATSPGGRIFLTHTVEQTTVVPRSYFGRSISFSWFS